LAATQIFAGVRASAWHQKLEIITMRPVKAALCLLALTSCSRAISPPTIPAGLPNPARSIVQGSSVPGHRLADSGYKDVFRFNRTDGDGPNGSLIVIKGTMYGTTHGGGANQSAGTIFKVTTSGAEKVLHDFKLGADGAFPAGGLLDVNGVLYGTTQFGGTQSHNCRYGLEPHHPKAYFAGCGTLFKVTTSGSETVLYRFKGGQDGSAPSSTLVALNGMLYGTTGLGGKSYCGAGCGTVFSITTAGKEQVLYRFKGYPYDGEDPVGLVVLNGELYGTTDEGGSGGVGTVFKVSVSGKEQVIHSFKNGTDGAYPATPLIAISGDDLYGTTQGGGGFGYGTVYKISSTGTENVIYPFKGKPRRDGANPLAPLIDVSGTFYATTFSGGTGCPGAAFDGCGTVFSITAAGKETVLYRFAGGRDGAYPEGGLTAVNGKIYGTTSAGGNHSACYGGTYSYVNGCGIVFQVSP